MIRKSELFAMPELAECALFAHDINRHVGNRPLTAVSYGNDRKWGKVIVPDKVHAVLNKSVGKPLTASSKGKSIYLDSSTDDLVTFKLGMTGRFSSSAPKAEFKKHVFLQLDFDDRSLWYIDYRKFGRTSLTPRNRTHCFIGGFDGEFYVRDYEAISSMVHLFLKGHERTPMISWLLKYGPDTGVGNYMANEALGRLKLNPFSPCVSAEQATSLLSECGEVAREAYTSGGNSFAGGYFRLNGDPGEFDSQCQFYRSSALQRQVFRGRPVYSTYIAPARAAS